MNTWSNCLSRMYLIIAFKFKLFIIMNTEELEAQFENPQDINLRCLRRINPNISQILCICKSTAIFEYDPCVQIWHKADFQGPTFLVETTKEKENANCCHYLILMNQVSLKDFVHEIRPDMKMEFSIQNNNLPTKNFFQFSLQKDQQKFFSLWIADSSDIQALRQAISKITQKPESK